MREVTRDRFWHFINSLTYNVTSSPRFFTGSDRMYSIFRAGTHGKIIGRIDDSESKAERATGKNKRYYLN